MATRPSKTLCFPFGKQAFLQNRSFASKDGWDRVLRPLVDVWGPLEKARGGGLHAPKKKVLKSQNLKKKFFGASRSPEGAPQMATSPIDSIFTMPRAQARSTPVLQGGRAQGALPPCKTGVDLFCGRPRARRSQDGTFSPPWRLLGCPKRPQEKVLKIRGGHQNGRKLDSLLFYRLK